MDFLVASFIAGFLTILAPCMLPVLPVIVGGSAGEGDRWRPVIIVASLGLSILLFTILLKFTADLLFIPTWVWVWISATIITFFGLTLIFPDAWDKLAFKLKLYKSEELMNQSKQKKGIIGTILLGASLGPVFSSCSPTYALIIAIVLPQSFALATLNALVYVIGFMIPLAVIAKGGQAVIQKFKGLANPKGWFKKSLGVLLVLVGIGIFFGVDKLLEIWILDSGIIDGILNLETELTEELTSN
ncbi:cytochrome C biogenesis protein [Candidatus Peregrinibacteria bacterium]|nr:cytochrome C biogenesis protein [Candidatus Peregrinibacteria bacterium]